MASRDEASSIKRERGGSAGGFGVAGKRERGGTVEKIPLAARNVSDEFSRQPSGSRRNGWQSNYSSETRSSVFTAAALIGLALVWMQLRWAISLRTEAEGGNHKQAVYIEGTKLEWDLAGGEIENLDEQKPERFADNQEVESFKEGDTTNQQIQVDDEDNWPRDENINKANKGPGLMDQLENFFLQPMMIEDSISSDKNNVEAAAAAAAAGTPPPAAAAAAAGGARRGPGPGRRCPRLPRGAPGCAPLFALVGDAGCGSRALAAGPLAAHPALRAPRPLANLGFLTEEPPLFARAYGGDPGNADRPRRDALALYARALAAAAAAADEEGHGESDTGSARQEQQWTFDHSPGYLRSVLAAHRLGQLLEGGSGGGGDTGEGGGGGGGWGGRHWGGRGGGGRGGDEGPRPPRAVALLCSPLHRVYHEYKKLRISAEEKHKQDHQLSSFLSGSSFYNNATGVDLSSFNSFVKSCNETHCRTLHETEYSRYVKYYAQTIGKDRVYLLDSGALFEENTRKDTLDNLFDFLGIPLSDEYEIARVAAALNTSTWTQLDFSVQTFLKERKRQNGNAASLLMLKEKFQDSVRELSVSFGFKPNWGLFQQPHQEEYKQKEERRQQKEAQLSSILNANRL